MRHRVALGLLSAFMFATCAERALAQAQDWLPCSFVGAPGPGGSGGPGAYHPALTGLGQIAPDREEGIAFTVDVGYADATFNEFDGAAIPEIRVRTSTATFAAHLPGWSAFIVIPHHGISDDFTPASDGSGLGDVALGFERHFRPRGGDGAANWWSVGATITLPTGDDERNLGHAEPTLTAHGTWHVGEDRASLQGQNWVAPRWLFAVGLAAMQNFAESDHSTVGLFLAVSGGGEHVTAGLALNATQEVAGSVRVGPGVERDAWTTSSATGWVAFHINEGQWDITLAGRAPLSNDGLTDSFIPSASVAFRWD